MRYYYDVSSKFMHFKLNQFFEKQDANNNFCVLHNVWGFKNNEKRRKKRKKLILFFHFFVNSSTKIILAGFKVQWELLGCFTLIHE